MSRVYMLRTVPIWNTVYTPVSFFLSGLILGPLALGLLFTFVSPSWLPPDAIAGAKVLPMLSGTALAFLVVGLVLALARIAGLLPGTLEEKQAIGRLFGRHKKIFFVRFASGLLGAAGLIAMLVQSHYDPFCYFFGFAIVLIAELLDRYIFYAAREVSRL
jgi:anaerobic dimethyl sulfoxide reductase subunit C (anchor subunit)